jgi:hypothetical protein
VVPDHERARARRIYDGAVLARQRAFKLHELALAQAEHALTSAGKAEEMLERVRSRYTSWSG